MSFDSNLSDKRSKYIKNSQHLSDHLIAVDIAVLKSSKCFADRASFFLSLYAL